MICTKGNHMFKIYLVLLCRGMLLVSGALLAAQMPDGTHLVYHALAVGVCLIALVEPNCFEEYARYEAHVLCPGDTPVSALKAAAADEVWGQHVFRQYIPGLKHAEKILQYFKNTPARSAEGKALLDEPLVFVQAALARCERGESPDSWSVCCGTATRETVKEDVCAERKRSC